MAEIKKVNIIDPKTCPLCDALKKLKEKPKKRSWWELIFVAIGAWMGYKMLKSRPMPIGQTKQKICIPIISTNDNIGNAYIADKFGKATHLLFIFPNKNPVAVSIKHLPTGIDIARMIISRGADTVLVGSIGDKTKNFLQSKGVTVKSGYSGKANGYLKSL